MSGDDIEKLRGRIDELDSRLLELINQRAECAVRIGRSKRETEPGTGFYRPHREASLLRRLLAENRGPLDNDAVAVLFGEIMSVCRALEQEITAAYLGPEGTFTQEAVFRHFGHAVTARGLPTISEVFRAVQVGESAYGVVPVENSSEGSVAHTLDCFVDSDLKIVGEVELRIHHCLLSCEKSIGRIETVYSHQQSLAQCRGWLATNLAHCRQVAVNSNAEAARRAASEVRAAAIAGPAAAEEYGISVLARRIEDHAYNTTRFLVVGHEPAGRTGNDKTSVLVSAQNRPGSLAVLLQLLSRHGISLTRVESRPTRIVNWEYVFFLDMEGHHEDEAVGRGLSELEREAELYKFLGSYPASLAGD